MLEHLGLTGEQERLYVALLRAGEASAEELAAGEAVTVRLVRRSVAVLEELGLVSRAATGPPLRYVPAQPDIALEALVIRRREELERARLAATELLPLFHRGRSRPDSRNPVELVAGAEAVRQRYLQLQATAHTEVLTFDRPPYVVTGSVNKTELDSLARGVAFRVVYDESSLKVPGKEGWLRESVAAGEQARYVAALPCKLNIADGRLAMTFDATLPAVDSGVVVYPSPLLDALLRLFEATWSRATPLGCEHGDGRDAVLATVRLLAAGLKDEAIARQQRVHLRTVRRRIASALAELDSTSRFQAGVEAARRGWV